MDRECQARERPALHQKAAGEFGREVLGVGSAAAISKEENLSPLADGVREDTADFRHNRQIIGVIKQRLFRGNTVLDARQGDTAYRLGDLGRRNFGHTSSLYHLGAAVPEA